MTKLIEYESDWKDYHNEQADIKNNTVRSLYDKSNKDIVDSRASLLEKWSNSDEWYIKIIKADKPNTFFIRQIQDVTFWGDFVIITWSPKYG